MNIMYAYWEYYEYHIHFSVIVILKVYKEWNASNLALCFIDFHRVGQGLVDHQGEV